MRRRLTGVLMLSAALMILNSCKDDPAPPSLISFTDASQDVIESDGTLKSFNPEIQSGGVGQAITVKITFDRAMADNSVISYTVSGTASKQTTIKTSGTSQYKDYSDFYLDGTNAKDTESLIVNKGDTEASIPLTIFEDASFEDDETIILTLTSVVSGPAKLSDTNLAYTINIKEDDIVIIMGWETGDGTNDADLDMIVKSGGEVINSSVSESIDGSLSSNSGGEGLFLPAGFPAGTYQLSYPYFSGTSNDVNFTVYMQNTAGTLNGQSYPYGGNSALSNNGHYTVNNVHAYTDYVNFTDVTTVEQTMVKSGINYASISGISTTTGTSRTSSSRYAPLNLNKEQVRKLIGGLKLKRK
jgi:hypothetical protein